MNSVNLHKSIEIVLSTGMMAFIMTGAISALRLGLTQEMISTWASTYPFSWLFAIPSILLTKKVVAILMSSLVTG